MADPTGQDPSFELIRKGAQPAMPARRVKRVPEDIEKRRERQRAYRARMREEDPERHKELARRKEAQKRARNPEKVRAKDRERAQRRRQMDPERYKALDRKKWARRFARNPEACRAQRRRRDVRRRLVDTNRRWLAANNIYSIATTLLPAALPRHIREDVIGEIALALMEGKLAAADLRIAAPAFLKKYNRDFGCLETVSLDECIPGTRIRRVDAISSDAFD